MLHDPAECDLRSGDVVGRRDRVHSVDLATGDLATAERGVGLQDDVVVFREIAEEVIVVSDVPRYLQGSNASAHVTDDTATDLTVARCL